MNEILRIVDTIHRDKEIDKEIIFRGIELALESAAKKHFGKGVEVEVNIDRMTGEIAALKDGVPVDHTSLGRIAAQSAKQVMISKIREAERDVIYEDYEKKLRQMVTGTVQRMEGGLVVVNLGRTEGILPRSEQVRGEMYKAGDRIRCLIIDVVKNPQNVKIILSRAHVDLVRRLFEVEIPEISEKIIEIKEIVREPGNRTKIAVYSIDMKVDAVGACVGVRGSRIKNIVDELNNEKVDIIGYSDVPEIYIGNALKPAEGNEVYSYSKTKRAEVVVNEDQLSLAIGKRGQNVRLAAKLTGWEIDVYAPEQMKWRSTEGRQELAAIPEVEEEMLGHLVEHGFGCWQDIVTRGVRGLMHVEGMEEETAERFYEYAREQQEEKEKREAEEAAAAEAQAQAQAEKEAAEAEASAAEEGETTEGEVSAEEGEAPPEEPAPEPEAAAVEQAESGEQEEAERKEE